MSQFMFLLKSINYDLVILQKIAIKNIQNKTKNNLRIKLLDSNVTSKIQSIIDCSKTN